jgi:uridine kinase
MNHTIVVAISGVSGAGKTTIVKELAGKFNCPFLLFDSHTDNNTYPANMKAWLKNGADVSLIKTPTFAGVLQDLITKSSSRFIFIEEPFGKERDVMSTLIDYVVLLDQPLELCLSRIIKRQTDDQSLASLRSISSYLDKYVDHYRDIYRSTAKQVRNNCDLAIDEVASIESTARCISDWLENDLTD